jgi:hypothetical protein
VRAAVTAGRLWLAGAILLLLLTAFIALLGHLNRMLYGDVPPDVAVGERRPWPVVVLGASAGLLVVLGLALPAPVTALLRECAGLLR